MESLDPSILGYLVFILPGGVFVWTYRHFRSLPRIGEFEYALWSFIFGFFVLLFVSIVSTLVGHISGSKTEVLSSLNHLEWYVSSAAFGLGVSVPALLLGYLCAGIMNDGLFDSSHRWLKKFMGTPKEKK